jgi:hypothetical protein
MAASNSICGKVSLVHAEYSVLQRGRVPVLKHYARQHSQWERHARGTIRCWSSSVRRSCALPAAATSSRVQPEPLEAASLPLSLPDYCAGCGVKLQEEDPDLPG